MDRFLELLKKAHDLLIGNLDIADIFNTDDDRKEDINFFNHTIFKEIDWAKVFNCFDTTINYLLEYAYKNDDINGYQMDMSAIIYDLREEIELKRDVNLYRQMSDHDRLLLLKTHVLLLMFSVTATITKDVSRLVSNDLVLLKESSKESFFRGHSDEGFRLIPSIFRSYNASKYGEEMTYPTLYNLYNEANLLTKYGNVFNYSSINNEFCAFMQHSCSYSPFLDLTKNHIIALSFATSNHGNLNEYFRKKSAIFEFKFNENVLTDRFDISKMWVYFVKGRLRFFSIYKDEHLFYCVPNMFDPTICLLDEKTNDRMKYQDGAFLFFQSCIVVNGHVLMPYKIGKIIKYTISPSKKEFLNKACIYQKIVDQYRKYDYEHLMDPYLYFSEITKR